ncbi:MAG: DUF3426 domain-containing protein [Pseudomonadota bacterium]
MGLILLLSAQLAWHYRQEPLVHDLLDRACFELGCRLPPLRQPEALTITDRLFALHPQRDDILILHLRVLNQAVFAQPYPGINLELFDMAQAVVGRRHIPPGDYLDTLAPGRALLAPGEAADVTLHLWDTARTARGFSLSLY